MKQYQVAVSRLSGKARDDEETLTDLLNERARMGWQYSSMVHLVDARVAVVFERQT